MFNRREVLMLLITLMLLGMPLLPGCHGASENSRPTEIDQSHPAESLPAALPTTLPAEPAPPVANPHKPDGHPQLEPGLDALLDQLERGAVDLRAFIAKVTYEKQDDVLGRTELRTGEIIYRVDQDTGEKSFAISFDTTIINRKKRNELKRYVFNGRWLAEIDPAQKQFIKREIVPPGKQLDPLKLGEGPFPLPIGQPKREVLARFDVRPAELPREGWLKDLTNVAGLLLVPKPGTKEADDFTKVELFYDRTTHLPVGINAIEANGNRKTVRLHDLQRNPTLDQAELSKLSIEEPDPREWRIDVRPWREE